MSTSPTDPEPRRSRRLFAAVIVLAAVSALAVTALLINIFERKQEAKNPFYRVVELNDTIDDPATWAKNFPLQYDLYMRTVDMQRTKYGGSEAMPHSPTEADPRSVVARSKLQEDPRLKTIWAGYSFSADYRERRGHAYMLEDQTFTERQKFTPPAMCINCHASLVTTFLKLGDGDLTKGFNVISDTHMTYPQIRQTVKHPVACIDCHDPENDAATNHPSGVHGRYSRAEGFPRSSELRCQHNGHAPGDAFLCVRSVPRDVLFPAAE